MAGGWQALRPEKPPGVPGIAPGEPFDVMTLSSASVDLIGREGDELLDGWIFAGGRGLIDCVWRAGIKRVSGGRHRERAGIERRYAAALRTLLA